MSQNYVSCTLPRGQHATRPAGRAARGRRAPGLAAGCLAGGARHSPATLTRQVLSTSCGKAGRQVGDKAGVSCRCSACRQTLRARLHLPGCTHPLRAHPGGPPGRPQAHQVGALEVAVDDAVFVQVQHACRRGAPRGAGQALLVRRQHTAQPRAAVHSQPRPEGCRLRPWARLQGRAARGAAAQGPARPHPSAFHKTCGLWAWYKPLGDRL